MEAVALAEGLWRWRAPQPEGRECRSVYYEASDATVLFDPLVPAGEEERFFRHLDADVERRALPVVILLTTERNRRSADELAGRYRARIGGPLPESVDEIPIEGVAEREVAYFIRPHAALVVAEVASAEASSLTRLRLPVERLLVSR